MYRVCVAADVLGGRVHDDVSAMVERTADHRSGGIIEDQRNAELFGDRRDFGDWENFQHGIRQGLGVVGAGTRVGRLAEVLRRSEEHTSELQSLMRISYAVFCLKKKSKNQTDIMQTT